jgi:hypothetical protein
VRLIVEELEPGRGRGAALHEPSATELTDKANLECLAHLCCCRSMAADALDFCADPDR